MVAGGDGQSQLLLALTLHISVDTSTKINIVVSMKEIG